MYAPYLALNGNYNLSNLITVIDIVNTNQHQTSMTLTISLTVIRQKKKRTDIKHFVMDEQLDVLFITGTWLRCQDRR